MIKAEYWKGHNYVFQERLGKKYIRREFSGGETQNSEIILGGALAIPCKHQAGLNCLTVNLKVKREE